MARRAGVVAAHSLDHFSLSVPDLDEAAIFYERFGLDPKANGNALDLYAAGNPHRWGRYHAEPSKVLNYLSFGVYEDDLPAFRKRLADHQIALVAPPPHAFDDSGLWFHDDDENVIELRVAEKCSPDAKAAASNPTTPEGVVAMPLRVDAPFVRPRTLSHILIFTTDVDRAVAFYTEIVGLALSDAAADVIAFMHGVHGSDHHLVAFAKSDYRGFHHCSWDVGSVNDVGLGAMQMADAGYTRGWGFGRHVLGSNYFHYIRDPWGSYCEYSHDIDYVPAGGNWQARRVSPENGFYLWGPTPPEDFAFNYESPAATLTKDLLSNT